jgi:hypothetical protein
MMDNVQNISHDSYQHENYLELRIKVIRFTSSKLHFNTSVPVLRTSDSEGLTIYMHYSRSFYRSGETNDFVPALNFVVSDLMLIYFIHLTF